MKCDQCPNDAVAYLRYFNRKLCAGCFKKLTEQRFTKAITKNKLIDRGHKIGVAVSGGKDSITLLHLLGQHAAKYPIELFGIVIDEGIDGYRENSIPIAEKNFKDLDVDYTILSYKDEFGKTLDDMCVDRQRNACSYCGVFRRRLINKAARDASCDKLATGHNLDDEVQSIMMNYFRGDFERLSRSGPSTPKQDGYVQRIKPMRDIPEKESALYAVLNGFEIHLDECPYAGEAFRTTVRDLINDMEDKSPGIKFSILNGADNLTSILKGKFSPATLKTCKCGEKTVADTCKACKLLEEL